MEDIDLDELRSIGEEGVGAMAYLEKWLRKRPPMEPNQPQEEGVNVAEEIHPLHEPAIEVENAAAQEPVHPFIHNDAIPDTMDAGTTYASQHADGGSVSSSFTALLGSVPSYPFTPIAARDDTNAAGLPYTSMKITYRFPNIRFPNPTYQHIPLAYPSIVQDQILGESSQSQHYNIETTFGDFPGQCSQYRYNYDTTSLQGQSSAEFPFHDTTFRESASQLHDELIEEECEGSDEETDGSESSLEDVDAALEADGFEDDYIDGQINAISTHKPPCPMYTQDTWSNIIDPSPPMPTRSHLGWDGRSEFFEGQVIFSVIIKM
ncbi:hypothetical protein RHSIM_Rhsim06G0016000 [Rhododendron simsii]|uniref:Uncharacterized protein n=1 Tax=Rhododendron simsii TaxID=118357 RepID=A0A834GW12_RHOSS|nr:hypothetical protein RHSIM_Rhsim06G0016000 [Rhododendron simsii]